MRHYTRRRFLLSSGALLGSAFFTSSFIAKKYKPLLSFSTLGCPDWNFKQITDFAVANGYKGIEVRGLMREMDLPKCPEFSNEQSRSSTLAMMKEKGLRFVNLGSSATMHFADPAKRKQQFDDGRRYIDLAQQINCPYVRVFPNNFPKEQDRNTTMELIAKGLIELGDYAKASGVKVLMETHGDLVYTADLEKLMQMASHPNVGLVWDATNMWVVTKEAPSEMYKRLKPYIYHTHIKDAKLVDNKPQYTFLGQGEVPIGDTLKILMKDGFKGYYSFEWEKLWHKELPEPELALADYPKALKKYLK